jgi:hypothetical protein
MDLPPETVRSLRCNYRAILSSYGDGVGENGCGCCLEVLAEGQELIHEGRADSTQLICGGTKGPAPHSRSRVFLAQRFRRSVLVVLFNAVVYGINDPCITDKVFWFPPSKLEGV